MSLARCRGSRIGLIGLLVLASCFHPSVTPHATLGPAGPDSGPARTKGPFAVVYAAPRGHVADRIQPGVTVLFSRGVRSVEMADDERLPPIAITTRAGAPVAGAWRWTGTRGLLFTPEGGLPGGSDFVVTVPAGIKSLDGAVLGRPYTLELETGGPVASSITVIGPPGVSEKAMPSDPAFRIAFDQSVDPNAVLAASSLRVFTGDGDRGESVRLTASREASPHPATAVPEAYVVVLKPEKPLPLDREVELTIQGSLHGTGGSRAMGEPVTRSMRTHGPLRFVDFYCPRIEEKGRCRQGGDVKVVLSNPVAPGELKSHAHYTKLPSRTPGKGEKRRIDPSTDHWLGVAPKVGESYKVTLTAGMRDIYGQQLAKDASFDLVVEAPLVQGVAPPPDPQGDPGASPARPPHSRAASVDLRPHREKLPYRLDVGLVGEVLEANLNAGTHKVPVGAVNIPTYASVVAGLSEAQATSWTLTRGDTTDFLSRNGLVSTWVSPRAAENERAVDFLDLDLALAPHHGRGPALLVVASPGASARGKGRTESFVTVTDLGVSTKMSPYGGLVWITQLSTGKPVKGASVSVRTAKGGEVFQGTSDAEGLAVVPIERFDPLAVGEDADNGKVRSDAAIVVRSGDDWTITRVARSPIDTRLTSGFQALSKEGTWAGMLFADRGVFRPGETAKVSGIARVVETGGLRSIAGRELRVELLDRNGEQIFDGRTKCDDFGTFAIDVPVPKTAELGPATITATALPGGRSNTSEPGVFRHVVRVLAYKANEFKVEAEADKPSYVRGDTAAFTTQGDYLYGAPMPDASVTTTVSRQEIPFEPPGTAGFTITDDVFTGDYPDTTKAAEEIDTQDGKLDEHGKFTRSVALTFADQRRPERIAFDADVQDMSRRNVSARASVVVHPGEFYIALRTPADRFVAAGTGLRSEVAAIEPGGAHRPGVRVKVELVLRRWNGVVGEQPDGSPTHSNAAKDQVVASCDTTTDATVGACNLKVPHAGYFVVRATATDPRGNTVRASHSIYGTEDSPRTETAWASDDHHGLTLEANKKTYAIGETAKVLLRSPFKEGQALVTVERNGVLWKQVVPIRGPLPVVQVPIRPEFYPNAFVSVVALRGRIQAPPPSGADLGAPDYRFGYAELHVDQEAHRLNVTVTAPKPEYSPGALVDTEVVVTDRGGKPVESALTFYVVDEGVLALTSYKTPDPLPPFVQPRKLSVFTFDNRELLARIMPMKAGEHLSPLGFEYAMSKTPTDYDKGDDGGDGGAKRADFRTTAFFEAGRRTDSAGKAHFSFKVPDNLTTFRIMAVAAAADDRFGSGESKITTFRRLMARPALPRLVRVGDALEASVILSTKLDEKTPGAKMNVEVRFAVKGLTPSGPSTRTITMTRGGQAEVRFPVKAVVPGEALLSFEARSGSDVDVVEMKRKIELPVSHESAVIYGETSADAALALGDLAGIRRDQGGLDVRVAPTALVGLGTAVDRLTDYPYDCTEQLTSRALPLLSMLELSTAAGARMPTDVNAAIDTAVESLLKRQNGGGGFGYWESSSSEPWLSAYAMLALGGAVEKKRLVPKDVLERGRDYLHITLATATRKLAKTDSDDAVTKDAGAGDAGDAIAKEETEKAIDFATAALIADTLSTLGYPTPGALNILYDVRAGRRLFALAALLHAMVKSDMSTSQIKTLRREIEGRLREGPNEVDVDEPDTDTFAPLLDSHARTLAMVLRALLAADPHHPFASRLARRLLALRLDGAWRTTQENAWALLALADYRKVQEAGGLALDVRTFLGGSELLHSEFPPASTREDKIFVPADTLASRGKTLSFDVGGGGKLYYAAELKYASTALPVHARDEGLFVQKYVRGVSTSAVTAALKTLPRRSEDSVLAGDLVIVDLIFESAEPRDQVVLDDPLPAGLEALDYDLDTTSEAKRDAEARQDADPATKWLGTTFRNVASRRRVVKDDRVITFFEHLEPGMYRVHYLARAASIGAFVMPPTRIEAMYTPEVYGRTAASALTVRAKP